MNFNPQFVISSKVFNKCDEFAQASLDTNSNRYARRNQFNIAKIAKDIRNGKIAEEYVYQNISPFYADLTAPDYQIYAAKNKSWDPDLKSEATKLNLAVKSQDIESALAYGESWVFQFNNGGNYDCDKGIFKEKNPNHYVAFVALNVAKKTGSLRAVVKVDWLHQKHLFKEMKKKTLRGNKVAVYFEDLEKYPKQLFQLPLLK